MPCIEHGYGWQPPESLSFHPEWERAHVQREVDNVESQKNHASVVIWSLGNESGWGPNFDAAYHAVKKLDSTRYVHCEGWQHGGDANKGDLISQMYTSPGSMDAALKNHKYDEPLYLCEFAHAMNNSLGGLQEYPDEFYKYPGAMGGAEDQRSDASPGPIPGEIRLSRKARKPGATAFLRRKRGRARRNEPEKCDESSGRWLAASSE